MGSATYKMLLTLGPSDPETDTPARFLCAANESGPVVPLLGRLFADHRLYRSLEGTERSSTGVKTLQQFVLP